MRFGRLNAYRTGGGGGQIQLSVPPPRTPDGRVYRFSPNRNAHPRHFVLGDVERPESINTNRSRMKLEPGSTKTVCPYSGIVDDDQAFTHPDDQEAAIALVNQAVIEDATDEIARMLGRFNSRQSRNSLFSIKASVTKPKRPLLRFDRKDLLRLLVCDLCGRDYGVYAIALFCPDCGAPNLRLHFRREIELVNAQVAIADRLDSGEQELAYRLLGNAHEDVLTAFEATLKTVFFHLWHSSNFETQPPNVRNDFQNLKRSRERFSDIGLDPFSRLDDESIAILELNIQKRHVIGHNLGVVDARFAEYAGQASMGKTVHLVADDILQFARLSQQVIDELDAALDKVVVPIAASSTEQSG